MKFRHILFLAVLAIASLIATMAPGTGLQNLFAAWLLIFLAGNLLAGPSREGRLCATTLTVAEILTDVMAAFTTRVPAMNFFSINYGSQRVKYGQQIIAQLPSVPAVFDHNAANGYKNNAQSARTLLTDTPVVMDGWKDCPIKITDTDANQDKSQNYLKTINNAGYALSKAVVDYALTKITVGNFSQKTTESIPNTTKDTLSTVRQGMNGVKAGAPRRMLCSSAFFGGLDSDARITSNQSYNQRVGAEPFGHLQNIEGFTDVMEYPDFPNTGNLSAFGFDERAIGIATRQPIDNSELAQQLGLPAVFRTDEVVDPGTGLAMTCFSWIDENDHTIYIVFTIMFGAVGGSQGGAVGALTDYAGWRVVTA